MPAQIVTSMSDRLTVDASFQLMLSVFDMHAAAKRLNDAIERNEVWVWCDDFLHDPNFFTRNFRIEARMEIDGRRTAAVQARPGITMTASEYTWLMAGVESLVQREKAAQKRGAGGAPRTYNHNLILIEAAVMLFEAKGVLPLGKLGKPSLDALCDAVAERLKEAEVPERTTLTTLLGPIYSRLNPRK
jgi:hypothetical protein